MKGKVEMWTMLGRNGSAVVLALALALIPGMRGVGAAASASPYAAASRTTLSLLPPTKVTVFHPRGTMGSSVAGNCDMGGSLALNRADAWRCAVGNTIYDPCFAPVAQASWVICDATPTQPYGRHVTLPAPLPAHDQVQAAQPWILLLGDGKTCGFLTGATFGYKDQRANYGCTDQQYVIGSPQPGKVWYAVKVSLTGKFGPNGPIVGRVYAVSIAQVWM